MSYIEYKFGKFGILSVQSYQTWSVIGHKVFCNFLLQCCVKLVYPCTLLHGIGLVWPVSFYGHLVRFFTVSWIQFQVRYYLHVIFRYYLHVNVRMHQFYCCINVYLIFPPVLFGGGGGGGTCNSDLILEYKMHWVRGCQYILQVRKYFYNLTLQLCMIKL